MNRIVFTKKYLLISLGIGVTFLFMLIGFWFVFLAPKMTTVAETQKEMTKTQTEITEIKQVHDKLKDFPTLLESEFVKEVPVLPNGMELATYFQELKGLDSKLDISIANINFDHQLVFPENLDAPTQLRRSLVGFDVLATNGSDLRNFVKGLEESQRFVRVQQVTYRYNSLSDGDNNYSYAATIVAVIYYLSHYETGKNIPE